MTDWTGDLRRLLSGGNAVALVTVAGTFGSAPREAGAKMLVAADHAAGTIGGGNLEFTAIDLARKMLAGESGGAIRSFQLGPSLQQCCGGQATLCFEVIKDGVPDWLEHLDLAMRSGKTSVLITRFDPSRKAIEKRALAQDQAADCRMPGLHFDPSNDQDTRLVIPDTGEDWIDRPGAGPALLVEPIRTSSSCLYLFGAGHVGRALVSVLADLPGGLVWIDSRAGQFPAEIRPDVQTVIIDDPVSYVDEAVAGTDFLVMTHSHELDLELCEAIFRRGDFGYFGLIGSMTKRKRFEQRLVRKGISAAELQRLTCPIGLPGITGKRPAEIAVAVAAQLLQRRSATTSVGSAAASAEV